MKLNYTKMWLELVCSSLHTDLLNLRTKPRRISVMAVARSGSCRNWMWNHVICWCCTWGCLLTSHMLLWGRHEGSPPWATSDHLPRDYCMSLPLLLLLCAAAAPALLQSLCAGRVAVGVSWFPPLLQLTFPDDWSPLLFLAAWGHCWLMVTVIFALWTKSPDFDDKTFSLGSH